MRHTDSTTVFGQIARVQEVREVNGTPVLNFVIVSQREWNGKQYSKYFDCSLWGDEAEEYELHPGMEVGAIGSVSADVYIKPQDGPRAKLVLRVRHLSTGKINRAYGHDAAPANTGGTERW